jgi:type IV pilus assembly protein PilM
MPLDRAVLDHQVVGGVAPTEGASAQIDVVVVAARREMVSSFLEPLRRAGLEPVGVDLSAFAMVRALADVGAAGGEEAVLYCNVGDTTNLAVARGRACLFTRVSHAGLEPAVRRLMTNRGLRADHAEQWLSHVGLEAPVEQVEGDRGVVGETREALEAAVTALVDELRLSLDYYRAQDGAVAVERVLLCGPAAAVPGLTARMEAGLGLPIASTLPAALGDLDPVLAARLTLPFGLALEA